MTLAEQIKQVMEWDLQNRQTVFPDKVQLQLTEVIRQLTDIVKVMSGALGTCGEDYVYNGEDEVRVLTYDEDLVEKALALSAPIVKGVA